jgi:hypothetical protein
MKRKNLFPMTVSDLEAFSTKQLLGRLKSLHRCEESLAFSDRSAESYQSSSAIEFKDSPEWMTEFKKLKEVLAGREHVPKRMDLAAARRQKARGKSERVRVVKSAKR